MLFASVKTYNFGFLLAGLLLSMLLLPLVSGLNLVATAFLTEGAFLLTLLVGVWSLYGNVLWFRIGITLTVLTGIMTVGYAIWPSQWLSHAIALLTLLFLVLSLAIALKSVFSIGAVDINRLFGAACIYLMLALIWALMYRLLDSYEGQSLTIVTSEPFWEYLYFSFVTLTTLGYGDIAPATPAARVLASFEALVGQFYLTILVAALVGMLVAQRGSGRD